MGRRDFELVPATEELARELAVTMRAPDAAEVAALTGQTPIEALLTSVRYSDYSRAMFSGGELLMLFGLGRQPSFKPAVVWALSGDAVERHRGAFWQGCWEGLAEMLDREPWLFELVDARYRRSLRWLERLGFELGESVTAGVAGLPFVPVQITRERFYARMEA